MGGLSKFHKFFLYGLGAFVAFQAIAAAPIFFSGLSNILIAGAATAAVLNGGYQLAKNLIEKDKYPKYEYQAQDGSKITVDPARELVTRRLSKDFARAADFKKGHMSDVVTKQYGGNRVYRTARSLFDHTLNFTFNKYARVNTKTMQETQEYDDGAMEVMVMEKYLRHAQEQYQQDKLAKQQPKEATQEAEPHDGLTGAAPAAQPRKNKNAPGV